MNTFIRRSLWVLALVAVIGAGSAGGYYALRGNGAQASIPAAPPATPVSVATVEQRDVALWDEFSGRLEAVERVDVRSRVAGAVQAVHFREGALVKQGDLLITIDPAPYAAEVERAEAQVRPRRRACCSPRASSSAASSCPARASSRAGARRARQRPPRGRGQPRRRKAALQARQLNLGYTQVRAPVAGRVGRLEITVGNLVAAGPGAPVLTTLVSVNPIYASFDADEQVVARALQATAGRRQRAQRDRAHPGADGHRRPATTRRIDGQLQLIDNQVDAQQRHGARARRVRQRRRPPDARASSRACAWARPKAEPALLVNERAVGTDQNKKFVLVVGADNKAEYREVTLGASRRTACAS